MITHRDYALEEINKHLKKKYKHVLEVGSGLNSFERFISAEKYTKIDNQAQYKGDSINEDVHLMQYEEVFDLVFICHTAEHFVNPVLAWLKIWESLKKGGQIISITPNVCEHQILHGDNDHIFVLNEMQWTKLLKCMRFKNVKSYKQMTYQGKQIPKIQDYNIITVATK